MKTIDLRHKTLTQAKKAMKRLNEFRKTFKIKRPFLFLLPKTNKKISKGSFKQGQIVTRCPYCRSPLAQTEAGTVCTGSNLPDIMYELETVKRRYGDKAFLFISNRANRFWDAYQLMGRSLTCDYIMGNEEHKFRIMNRILRPGVDRKKIRVK